MLVLSVFCLSFVNCCSFACASFNALVAINAEVKKGGLEKEKEEEGKKSSQKLLCYIVSVAGIFLYRFIDLLYLHVQCFLTILWWWNIIMIVS